MAERIVQAVLREMESRSADRVRAIDLEVGELEGLRRSSIVEAFRVAAAGTVLEDADLRITFSRTQARCPRCDAEKRVDLPATPDHGIPPLMCPDCGTPLDFRGGRGFVVRRATMVLEDP